MSLYAAFPTTRVSGARNETWIWRLGGLRRLFGRDRADGKETTKRKAKFRIDNLADMNELRRTGGKQYEASQELTQALDSPLFPTITGSTLAGHSVTLPGNLRGDVALVTVAMRAFGLGHCELYSEPYKQSVGQNTAASLFELSLVDVWMYRMMSRWMTRNLIKTMSHDKHNHFMLYTGRDVPEIRKNLQLNNSIIGYVFLLDSEGRIRWKAHAAPTKQEIAALLHCSTQLLQETVP